MSRTAILWIVIIGGVVLLAARFPDALQKSDDKYRLLYLLTMMGALTAGVSRLNRANLSEVTRNMLIWVAIFLVLLLGYSYRDVLLDNRLVAELMPYRARVTDSGELAIRADEHGQFLLEAEVNHETIKFLVDTGASDIVLTPHDAHRVGIETSSLEFSRFYSTANGMVRGAPVVLRKIKVGPVTMEEMPASVNEAPMDTSLLGMTFLRQFKAYRVEDNTLTLQPRTQN